MDRDAMIYYIENELGLDRGVTVDSGEPIIIFEGWEQMGSVVMRYNDLDDSAETAQRLKDLGVTDVEEYLELVQQWGSTRIGKDGRNVSCFKSSPPYEEILPELDTVLEEVYGPNMTYGFSDEYDRCGECDLIIRTQADSYGWTPPYRIMDGEMICNECIQKDPEYYINHIKNSVQEYHSSAINIDLTEHGYAQVGDEDYCVGLNEFANDDPNKILKILREHNIDVIFEVSASQFDTFFKVYVPVERAAEAVSVLSGQSVKYPAGRSPADMAEAGLRQASKAMAEIPDEPGVTKHATIDVITGEVKVRKVSQKEFIDGLKN